MNIDIKLHKNDLPDNLDLGKIIAVDGEFMGLNVRRDPLCLIQVSSGNSDAHIIQLDRSKVYISNVVNYRPPENRPPTETEIKRYLPYLKNHIEIINPKILVLLGKTALNSLIGSDEVISKARGKWFQKEIGLSKYWVIASFHPAFLMRQPEQKKLAWIDLKMIRDKSKQLKL